MGVRLTIAFAVMSYAFGFASIVAYGRDLHSTLGELAFLHGGFGLLALAVWAATQGQ